MPAVEFERGLGLRATTHQHTTPLDAITWKKTALGLPRLRNSSADLTFGPSSTSSTASTVSSAPSSTASVAGISFMKPIKSAPSSSLNQRRNGGLDFLNDTPFEDHLEDIYAGRVGVDDGLSFFESHGYYDVSEANTVAMFRQNFDMKKSFWDGADHDVIFYEEMDLDTVDLAGLQVLSIGAMLSKDVKRQRTTSGRFQLLDDEGNEVDPETQYEAEREKRMKLKHMEVDDDDLADLAQAQLVLTKAITIIRTEKTRFRKYFFEACSEEMNAQERAVVPLPTPSLSVQLPPYSGYLYILKDTIPYMFRSWRKRWFYLDFTAGLAHMYKRSYWKSARGMLDMRSIQSVTRMNQSDICVQCFDGRSMLLRSKIGATDADLWVNLLQVARRQVGNIDSPAAATTALQQPISSTTETTLLHVMTKTVTLKAPSSGGNNLMVSTKIRAQNERSVLDTMAVLMQARASTSATSAA